MTMLQFFFCVQLGRAWRLDFDRCLDKFWSIYFDV